MTSGAAALGVCRALMTTALSPARWLGLLALVIALTACGTTAMREEALGGSTTVEAPIGAEGGADTRRAEAKASRGETLYSNKALVEQLDRHWDAEEWQQALTVLEPFMQRNPDDVDGLVRRAIFLRFLDRNGEALADIERAVELAPNNFRALFLRSIFYADLDRLSAAIAGLRRVTELDPYAAEL